MHVYTCFFVKLPLESLAPVSNLVTFKTFHRSPRACFMWIKPLFSNTQTQRVLPTEQHLLDMFITLDYPVWFTEYFTQYSQIVWISYLIFFSLCLIFAPSIPHFSFCDPEHSSIVQVIFKYYYSNLVLYSINLKWSSISAYNFFFFTKVVFHFIFLFFFDKTLFFLIIAILIIVVQPKNKVKCFSKSGIKRSLTSLIIGVEALS